MSKPMYRCQHRDAWVYNFNQNVLTENVNRMIGTYNAEVARWEQRTDRDANLMILWCLMMKKSSGVGT